MKNPHSTDKQFNSELEQCWLHQLLDDYEEIVAQYDVPLETPTIELIDSTHRLGCWDPEAYRIQISRNLIRSQPWFVTLQVLKHEMAHQLVDEMSVGESLPHGEKFKVACEMLGVLPQFRQPRCIDFDSVSLPWGKIGENTHPQVEKVRKLLALSESANEHEASLALMRARQIIRKYHLEHIASGEQENLTCLVIDGKRKRLPRYQQHICGLLTRFFMVRSVIAQHYDPELDDHFRVVELFGTRENVAVAEYCWYFLENHLQLQWSRQKKRLAGQAGRMRNSFFIGMVQGFSDRLHSEKLQSTPANSRKNNAAEMELELVGAKEVEDYLACYHPRLRRRRSSRLMLNRDTYERGRAAGKNLRFSKGVSGDDIPTRLLGW